MATPTHRIVTSQRTCDLDKWVYPVLDAIAKETGELGSCYCPCHTADSGSCCRAFAVVGVPRQQDVFFQKDIEKTNTIEHWSMQVRDPGRDPVKPERDRCLILRAGNAIFDSRLTRSLQLKL